MKKILVVVDYQCDFVDGSLGFVEAQNIESAIVEKISEYRNGGHDVAFTLDTHADNYLETQEGRNLPIQHCVKGTKGWELYKEVKKCVLSEDNLFEKGTFGSDKLYEFLKERNYDQIELCGLVTNICVVSNAILAKTACPEAAIVIDSKCVASNDSSLNAMTLEVMKSLQINVLNF